MQLYTVTMKRKVMTSIFTGKGGKEIVREERFIEEVYGDLPYQTALTYRDKFPDSFVGMEQQPETFYRKENRKAATRVLTKSDHKPAAVAQRKSEPKAAAIHAGSYADAINAAIKRESAS